MRVVSLTAEPTLALLERQRAHDRVGGRRHRQADAHAERQLRTGDGPEARSPRRRARARPGRRRGWPGRPRRPAWRPTRAASRADVRRAGHQPDGERHRPQAGAQRRAAEHDLQVLGHEEHRARRARRRPARSRRSRPRSARRRNKRRSSIGCGVRRSHAGERGEHDGGDGERAEDRRRRSSPRSGASMIAQTSAVRPVMDSAKPVRSSRGAAGSRDSGTSLWPASSAAATNGTLTRKTQCHEACSTSPPPVTGPIAMPRPATAAQMPIAFARSLVGEDVGEDRQRRGHDRRAADAHQRAQRDQRGRVARRRRPRPRRRRRSPGRR